MMSYPQFGYFAGITSSLSSSQLLQSGGAASTPTTTTGSRCCESGRPIMTDPATGQTICSCQYSLLNYSRMAAAGLTADGVYSAPYATAQSYMPFGTDPSAFYTASINGAYDLKTNQEAWKSLAHSSPYYPYDPAAMGYPYTSSYGPIESARRKNATRESTNTLKAWLYEHRKNPYPTKGEKIMLAIITKMTLTQVSTWFANARRRLKKENKMTWSPRNRTGDDDHDGQSEGENQEESKVVDPNKDDDDKLDVDDIKKDEFDKILDGADSDGEDAPSPEKQSDKPPIMGKEAIITSVGHTEVTQAKLENSFASSSHTNSHTSGIGQISPSLSPSQRIPSPDVTSHGLSQRSSDSSSPKQTPQKPKIWSVADVVTADDTKDRRSPRTDTDAVISHPQYPSSMNSIRKWSYSGSNASSFPYSYPLPPSFTAPGAYSMSGMSASVTSALGAPSRVTSTQLPGYSSATPMTISSLYGAPKSSSAIGNSSGAK